MVTLVSIKLRGESDIIDDNPTMKQADEMSQEFIRDPYNFNVFYIFKMFWYLFWSLSTVSLSALVVVRVSLLSLWFAYV